MGQRYRGKDGTIYEAQPGGGYAIVSPGAAQPGIRAITPPPSTDPTKAEAAALDLEAKRLSVAKARKDAAKEQVNDDQVEALAKLYAANKLVPPTRPNDVAQMAIARAMQIDPNYDPALAANRSKAIKDFSGRGSGSLVVQSVNRLASHLNDMFEASEKMGGPNLGLRPLNKLVANVEQQGMPTLVAQYDSAKPFVATELEKIMKGAGQPNVAGINEAMASLDRARSLDERRAAFKQIGALVHGALAPVKDSWNSAYGGTYAPPMWVSPQAAQVFGKIDPENAGTFGGDDWRGLPGLKGTGNQPTPPPGAPPAAGAPPSGPGDGPPVGPDLAPATGGTKTDITRTPADKKLAAMFEAGAPSANIRAFAKANDFPSGKLESMLAWRAMNPTYKGGWDVHHETIVPTTAYNRAAASPVAAGLLSAADAGTAGFTDEAAGAVNALRSGGSVSDAIRSADASKQMLLNANPKAALAGSVVGGTAAMLGGGLGVKALLEGGAKAGAGRNLLAWAARNPVKAALAGDTAYGTAYGAGENNDDRALGAAVGGLTAVPASLIGQGGTKVVGSTLRGVVNPAVDRLRAAGIPLTVGEVLGGGAKVAQDAMTSVFGPGGRVAARYADGRRALSNALFNQAGDVIDAPIYNVGQKGIEALDAAKSRAYSDALDPVTLDLNTPKFTGPMQGIVAGAKAIPAADLPQGYAENAIQTYVGNNILPNGTMTGSDFQKAYRGLAQTARKVAPKVEGHDMGQALGQAKDVLASTLLDQNPDAYAGFLKANTANRYLNVLSDAVNAAKGRVSDAGEVLPTPLDFSTASTNNAKRLTGNIAAASGNRPFNQVINDAQQVMSSKLPDSGTATRRLAQAALLGTAASAPGAAAGYGEGGAEGAGLGAAGTAAVLTALGTRRGQQLLTAALLKRVQPFRIAGTAIRNNPQVGADILTAAGIPLLARPAP